MAATSYFIYLCQTILFCVQHCTHCMIAVALDMLFNDDDKCQFCDEVGLSVVLSVCRISAKVISRFHWSLCYDWTCRANRKNLLTFGGDPVPDTDSGLLFNFRHHCEIGTLGNLLAFLIQSPADFYDPRRNGCADKIMINSQHFVRYAADIRIRIWVNPKIWICIPDHFWLRLDALAEVCALSAQSSLRYFKCCICCYRFIRICKFLWRHICFGCQMSY